MIPGPAGTPPSRLTERRDAEPGSSDAFVISLLRGQRPYRMPVGRRQRVRGALARANLGRSARALLRAAVALGVLVLCGGAVAGAHLLGWTDWGAQRHRPLAPKVSRIATPSPATDRSAPTPIASVANTPEVPRTVSVAGLRLHRHARVRDGRAPEGDEDESPVLAALRLLRRAHDPVHARVLLDVYLRQHPDGMLAQEALAISIEAAVSHHDADAASLATRYLTLYPSGPYSALAQQTLRATGH